MTGLRKTYKSCLMVCSAVDEWRRWHPQMMNDHPGQTQTRQEVFKEAELSIRGIITPIRAAPRSSQRHICCSGHFVWSLNEVQLDPGPNVIRNALHCNWNVRFSTGGQRVSRSINNARSHYWIFGQTAAALGSCPRQVQVRFSKVRPGWKLNQKFLCLKWLQSRRPLIGFISFRHRF